MIDADTNSITAFSTLVIAGLTNEQVAESERLSRQIDSEFQEERQHRVVFKF